MKLFVTLVALLVAAEARPSKNSGQFKAFAPIDTQIISGTPAPKGKWPWQLALEYLGSHTCGATLIKTNRALTACHCVDGREIPANFQLIVGASDRTANDEEEIRQVTAIFEYPTYNPDNLYAEDVAVLALDADVTINQYVQLATLAATGSNWEGQTAYISGWGKISGQPGGSVSTQLLEAQVDVLSNADCAARMPSCCTTIGSWHQCIFDNGVSGVCQGDSGGPLHVSNDGGATWFVDGAASWVISEGISVTCSVNYPSVYARASEFRDWILAQ